MHGMARRNGMDKLRCGPPWLLLSKPPMPRKPPPTKLKPPAPPPAVRCKVGATGWARCRIRPSRI